MSCTRPGNVARGLKAALSNPNTSEEAKKRAAQRLLEMEASGELDPQEAHEDSVALGHKGAISNPRVREETKEHCAQVLEAMGRE